MKRQAVYLGGPTAVGKSAVAMALARFLNGEIISVDSMQVYRGMDIGTAKPSVAERSEVRHHLIDVADITEAFDAAKFVALAKRAEADILGRGKMPIYCGGTGFYFNAFLQGLGEAPASNPEVRAALEQIPLTELLEELRVKDPAMFEEIDRNNPRRVIRAVEVIRLTGKPFSAQRVAWKPAEANGPLIGLDLERDELYKRIEDRVDRMFVEGLIEETQRLVDLGLKNNRTAKKSIGYQQVLMHFAGVCNRAESVQMVKTATRHFAKRQLTWFRNQLPCQWLEVKADDTPNEIARQLINIHKLV